MVAELNYEVGEEAQALANSLNAEWEQLCAAYLPVILDDSIWRYSRPSTPGDAEQGWKLHISANLFTAVEVLGKVGPVLRASGTQFKAPSSLSELQKLNTGLFYGYSQVGKFITVYPRTAREAVSLARRLDRLTRGMSAPSVPFDQQFRSGSCVYYRYGSFKRLEVENTDGSRTPAIRDPQGQLIPDVRESDTGRPGWVLSDPFAARAPRRQLSLATSPLATTFRAVEAITQRGKGGVYKVLDFSVNPPRLCIMKEGRAGGELSWDRCDGRSRVLREERVLASLRESGIAAPCVYASFEVEGNYYLITELIRGKTLQSILLSKRRRLPLRRALLLGARLAALISQIHSAGWAWRDCKPANIVVTPDGDLRPLDFEGACPVHCADTGRWSTRGFAPPPSQPAHGSGVRDDLYALGAIIYLLLTGRIPEAVPLPIEKLRRNVPARVLEVVSELLKADPQRLTDAKTVSTELAAAAARCASAAGIHKTRDARGKGSASASPRALPRS